MDESNDFGKGYATGMTQGYKDGVSAERERLSGMLDDELQFVLEYGCREEDYKDGIRFAMGILDTDE